MKPKPPETGYVTTPLGQIFYFVGWNNWEYPTGFMELSLDAMLYVTESQLYRGWLGDQGRHPLENRKGTTKHALPSY